MECHNYLRSLPFLIPVTFDSGPSICKKHLKQILQSEDDDLDITLFFPNHLASIEPISHTNAKSTAVAFFCSTSLLANDKEGNDDSASTTDCDLIANDPALVRFSAYLVSANYLDPTMNSQSKTSNKQGISPVPSTGSTSKSKSQSPWTPGHGPLSSESQEMQLLYFAIGDLEKADSETILFCVDHCQIRSFSFDLHNVTKDEVHSDGEDTSSEKLYGITTIQFDTCSFRILMEAKGIPVCEQEIKREEFSYMKDFILIDGQKSVDLRGSHFSFECYLEHMHPTNDAISEHQSNEAEGQTSHDIPMKIMNNDTEQNCEPKSLPSSENVHLVQHQLNTYNESWKAVQAVDAMVKLHTNGRMGTLNQENKVFTSILKTCSELCGKLYLTQSESEMIQEEDRLHEVLSRMEEQMDNSIRTLFPGKKNAASTNKLNSEHVSDLESQVTEQLEAYKAALRDRYNAVYLLKR
jgi:hypothetical protein